MSKYLLTLIYTLFTTCGITFMKLGGDSLKLSLVSCLYTSSGINGMILGQEYDIENEGKKLSKETLDKIHHYKTGKLLSCAFQMGALIASPNDLEILKQIGYKIGLAFQIQDDILDVTSDA